MATCSSPCELIHQVHCSMYLSRNSGPCSFSFFPAAHLIATREGAMPSHVARASSLRCSFTGSVAQISFTIDSCDEESSLSSCACFTHAHRWWIASHASIHHLFVWGKNAYSHYLCCCKLIFSASLKLASSLLCAPCAYPLAWPLSFFFFSSKFTHYALGRKTSASFLWSWA